MSVASGGPARRVVLLGASNLTQGISTVVETAQNIWRQRLEVLAAAGFGRSYGIESSVLGRRLPGILQCRLWDVLAEPADVGTAALITDIGNDLLYGVEVPQIVAWVGIVVDRLEQAGARICLTLLPPNNAANLSPAKFRFFRRLLFPNCRLELSDVLARSRELQERLGELGASRGVQIVEQRRHWYGFDPIHIRRRHWRHAWREILGPWNENADHVPLPARGSLSRWMYLQTRRPHEHKFMGRERRSAQPTGRLRDGTRVSFY